MIKNLRFFLVSMLVMLVGSAYAQDVVIDFNAMDLDVSYSADKDKGIEASTAGDITESKIIEQDGVKIVISPKEEGNSSANRFWKTNDGPQLRCYSGTIAISWTSPIKSIVFDAPNKFNLTTDKGTITGKTWSGEAYEVIFTVAGNTQINKITVSATGSVTPDPDPQPGVETTGKGTLESPYTVADALAVTSAMAADETSTENYYIKGKICSIKYTFSAQYGTATFNISETGQAGQDEFTCYGVLYLENKSWVDGFTQVKEGDEIIICGKVINYKGTTPETKNKEAYIYSLNGQTKAEGGTDPQPQPEVKAVTVAQALEIINGLADGAKTAEEYVVKGYVVSVSEISAQYGNATFTIADQKGGETTLTIFRTKGFNGENITDENLLKADDLVEVQGLLQKYVKNDVTTPELAQGGKIVSINGNNGGTDPQPQPEVKTITVAEALAIIDKLENGATTQETYQVKGFIVGAPDFQRKQDESLYGNVVLTMADTKGGSTLLTVFRGKSFDNQNFTEETISLLKENDEVVFQGNLQKYVKDEAMTPEIKNCYLISVNGQTSGIVAVGRDSSRQTEIYNLQGQRVVKAQKGLYIMNGRKYLVK